ncbi:MAG TPA: biopolymer transporter Tol [Opitutus sp.]|nr:biopolymer transporter Tol [Opitutus sp.]
MQKILPILLLLVSAGTSALAQREIGVVDVRAEKNTVPVRVSASTAELNQLALDAFRVHGRYRLTASSYVYDIRFSLVSPTAVRVDIDRSEGGASDFSQVVNGGSQRDALLRAADVAVERTNGLGLRGFFASQLAFIGKRTGQDEIYTSDLFFGEVRQLTHQRALALTPRWSPDGRRLLVTSYFKSGFPDIFELDLGTYQWNTFVSFKGTNSGARFSPDGRRVAMVLSGEGTPEIYVSNAQGRQIRRITARRDAVKSSPCWSPDGTRLVFTMEPGPQLYEMPAAGGAMTRITSGISNYCAEPDWSRGNPNKIAFTIAVGSGSRLRYQIAVLDLSTGKSEQVSAAAFDALEPCWLADGRHLVYTARNASTSRLCILDTETGRSTPISPTSFGPAMKADVLKR